MPPPSWFLLPCVFWIVPAKCYTKNAPNDFSSTNRWFDRHWRNSRFGKPSFTVAAASHQSRRRWRPSTTPRMMNHQEDDGGAATSKDPDLSGSKTKTQYLDLSSLPQIAANEGPPIRLAYQYDRIDDPSDSRSLSLPTIAVLWCGGFRSHRNGIKARYVRDTCRQRGETGGTSGVVACCRFDYRVHGESTPRTDADWLTEASIGNWIDDALAVLDHVLTPDKCTSVVVVGSSMGVWIALHMALARPHRVSGIVGVAAAPDFTEHLRSTFTPEQIHQMEQKGVVYVPSSYDPERPYPITQQLLDEARQWLVLQGDSVLPLPIRCPVRLLHGLNDVDVPWEGSLRVAQSLQSTDVQVTLIKDGDHRLSRPSDLKLLGKLLNDVLDKAAASIGAS